MIRLFLFRGIARLLNCARHMPDPISQMVYQMQEIVMLEFNRPDDLVRHFRHRPKVW
jgi:hypothetical protein